MAQKQKLFHPQRKHSIGPPQIIAKLDLINVRSQHFNNRADLTTLETFLGQVLYK